MSCWFTWRVSRPRAREPLRPRWLFRREVSELERRGRHGDFLLALANRPAAALLRQFTACAAPAAPELPRFGLSVPPIHPALVSGLRRRLGLRSGLPALPHTNRSTAERVRHRFVDEGLEAALSEVTLPRLRSHRNTKSLATPRHFQNALPRTLLT